MSATMFHDTGRLLKSMAQSKKYGGLHTVSKEGRTKTIEA